MELDGKCQVTSARKEVSFDDSVVSEDGATPAARHKQGFGFGDGLHSTFRVDRKQRQLFLGNVGTSVATSCGKLYLA